jgi:hypothetical protein
MSKSAKYGSHRIHSRPQTRILPKRPGAGDLGVQPLRAPFARTTGQGPRPQGRSLDPKVDPTLPDSRLRPSDRNFRNPQQRNTGPCW